MPDPEPPRSELRRLLKRPDARPRVSRAVASLLAASVAAIAVLGALIIWHLVRRGRLIREGLNRPRPVRWPVVDPVEFQREHEGDPDLSTGGRHDPEPTEPERRES
jgi:hypothetical protein